MVCSVLIAESLIPMQIVRNRQNSVFFCHTNATDFATQNGCLNHVYLISGDNCIRRDITEMFAETFSRIINAYAGLTKPLPSTTP